MGVSSGGATGAFPHPRRRRPCTRGCGSLLVSHSVDSLLPLCFGLSAILRASCSARKRRDRRSRPRRTLRGGRGARSSGARLSLARPPRLFASLAVALGESCLERCSATTADAPSPSRSHVGPTRRRRPPPHPRPSLAAVPQDLGLPVPPSDAPPRSSRPRRPPPTTRRRSSSSRARSCAPPTRRSPSRSACTSSR